MNYVDRYIDFLDGFIELKDKLKIVFDSSNGSAGPIVEKLFTDKENIDPIFINSNPDGNFPAHGPDPLSSKAREALGDVVRKERADLGVIFDGDGDRVFFVDEGGVWLDSYTIFSCIKDSFKPPYVVDVRALASITMLDIDIIEEKVGRYFIIKTMKDNNAELGVESSGHFYFKDFFYSDSGVLAAIYMINYVSGLKNNGETLSRALSSNKTYIRSEEENFESSDPKKTMEKIKDHFAKQGMEISLLDGVTAKREDLAFNVRASATEPLLRLSMVGKDQETIDSYLTELKSLIV